MIALLGFLSLSVVTCRASNTNCCRSVPFIEIHKQNQNDCTDCLILSNPSGWCAHIQCERDLAFTEWLGQINVDFVLYQHCLFHLWFKIDFYLIEFTMNDTWKFDNEIFQNEISWNFDFGSCHKICQYAHLIHLVDDLTWTSRRFDCGLTTIFLFAFVLNYSWFSVYWSCFLLYEQKEKNIFPPFYLDAQPSMDIGMLMRVSTSKSNCLRERKSLFEIFAFSFFSFIFHACHATELYPHFTWRKKLISQRCWRFGTWISLWLSFTLQSKHLDTRLHLNFRTGSVCFVLKPHNLCFMLRAFLLFVVCTGIGVFDL